jgi:HSP20 family protein
MRYPGSLLRELQQEFMPFLIGVSPKAKEAPTAVTWEPKVDVKETAEAFILYMDIPGIEAKDIHIEMEDNILSIKGERKLNQEEKSENYYHLERNSGKFYRKFTLPESIDETKILAKVKHGVLTLHLPKAQESKIQRKINVEEE